MLAPVPLSPGEYGAQSVLFWTRANVFLQMLVLCWGLRVNEMFVLVKRLFWGFYF